MKTIYKQDKFRIVEFNQYPHYEMNDLKGDCFDPKCINELNPGMTVEQLQVEEHNFEIKVLTEGVYGYSLEVWNPEVGQGWEHVDSCYGFIGQYENENHYIVKEMQTKINKLLKEGK